ncbi:MAG: hypothetical protein N2Z65_06520 [Clostridiales bacterium]|nr:hypothetical protein [Clostridiales bacterium]
MGEMEDKIQKLLSSEDGMKTVMSLASALMSGQGAKKQEATASETQENTTTNETPKEQTTSNEPDVAKLQETLSKIMGSNAKSNVENEKRMNLLSALKPFINPTRQGSIDRATRMIKTAKAAKTALDGFRGGNGIV